MKLLLILILGLCFLYESDGHRGRCKKSTTTAAPPPNKSLDNLYRAALAEGGRVIVYAGGDTAGQQDYYKFQFEKKFPNTTLDVIVDYSKFHAPRIDNQLATNSLIPDVVQLQTLQDFPRWKNQGILLQYRPLGWENVYDQFKDVDGYFTAIYVLAFSNIISKKMMPNNATWPSEANDYLRSSFKGKFVVTYPNDDDAVLFWFKQVVDKYGWSYVDKFSKQNPILVRGTQEPGDAVDQSRSPATPATAGDTNNPKDSNSYFKLPEQDPFVSWPQTAAIFKNAKRPATAKLYLSWLLDNETQKGVMWTVRKDGPKPATGLRGIFEYPGQSDPTAFGKWMADRGQVERFRAQLTQYMGEVKGEPSPGHPGSHPEKALPH